MRIRKINPNRNSDDLELTPIDLKALVQLRERLAGFPDRRVQGKVCFPLADVLLIAFCALLSDCCHFTEMALFANTQLTWLGTFMNLPNGAPSHDVFRNVFMAIKPQYLLEIMAEWAGPLVNKRIMIDGKCLRGTNQGQQGAAAKVYLIRAWVLESGLSVAQESCADKSGELVHLPDLLASLNIEGTTISIDAMGTYPEIAKIIHEGGGRYVLCLKKNQPQAYEEVKKHFDQVGGICPETPTAQLSPVPQGHSRHETVELSHGRYEQRIVTTTDKLAWFTRDWKWHGLKSITEVRRLSHRNGAREALSEEVHYYLSSLPAEAEALGQAIREHWQVENGCHHVLDMTFGEDHCQVQDANAAQNLSLLREVAAKVIKAYPTKESIAAKRKKACLSPVFRLKVLLRGFTSLFQA